MFENHYFLNKLLRVETSKVVIYFSKRQFLNFFIQLENPSVGNFRSINPNLKK